MKNVVRIRWTRLAQTYVEALVALDCNAVSVHISVAYRTRLYLVSCMVALPGAAGHGASFRCRCTLAHCPLQGTNRMAMTADRRATSSLVAVKHEVQVFIKLL